MAFSNGHKNPNTKPKASPKATLRGRATTRSLREKNMATLLKEKRPLGPFCLAWKEHELSKDPIFADEQTIERYKKSTALVQPYEHSADRFFPNRAATFGLKRIVLTMKTDCYTSEKRGPLCYTLLTGSTESCHRGSYLPAFIYESVNHYKTYAHQ